ncbi:hypothetical protein ACIBH1_45470 [Nonomuraea sp. NPDC050663]|uniref:hypothetical protein n=1 Tax=Nonomuraea sp. NPDC050663 TaxID=3364370 RepID=UPI0037AD26CC
MPIATPAIDLITPEIAGHLLWSEGIDDGVPPSSPFVPLLLLAIDAASASDRLKLAAEYGGYVAAHQVLKDGGEKALRERARGAC